VVNSTGYPHIGKPLKNSVETLNTGAKLGSISIADEKRQVMVNTIPQVQANHQLKPDEKATV